ncbi:MAG: hypothetical protein J6S32_01345 [Clostridia bacterium]|nr:hypothetical protein [Clostridia bacterium]
MNEKQTELIYEALRLIQRRSVDPRRDVATKIIYRSAYDMLLYAINENAECLAQYDDVALDCQDCKKFWSDDASDIQICNACCDHEFFEH